MVVVKAKRNHFSRCRKRDLIADVISPRRKEGSTGTCVACDLTPRRRHVQIDNEQLRHAKPCLLHPNCRNLNKRQPIQKLWWLVEQDRRRQMRHTCATCPLYRPSQPFGYCSAQPSLRIPDTNTNHEQICSNDY